MSKLMLQIIAAYCLSLAGLAAAVAVQSDEKTQPVSERHASSDR